jgi:hypothetical protein
VVGSGDGANVWWERLSFAYPQGVFQSRMGVFRYNLGIGNIFLFSTKLLFGCICFLGVVFVRRVYTRRRVGVPHDA